jgi:hypothetical protein
MEDLPATKCGKSSAVIVGIEVRRQAKFQSSTHHSHATQAVMALLKDYGIDKSSNGGLLCRPGTTSRDHEWATTSQRGAVQTFDRFQRFDDPSRTGRLLDAAAVIKFEAGPEMICNFVGDGALVVKVNDSVEVIHERTMSEAALASLRLTKGN